MDNANQLNFLEMLLPGDTIRVIVWTEAGYWRATVPGFWYIGSGSTMDAAVNSLVNNMTTESRALDNGYL